MENGNVIFDGGTEDALAVYQKMSGNISNYFIENSNKEIFIKSAKILNESNNFNSGEVISFSFEVGMNTSVFKNKYLLIRIMDNLEQVLFSCEVELDYNKKVYVLNLPNKTLVRGFYKLNCILYHPAVVQHDIVNDCCSFNIIDNIKEFSHLETFDIGKVYISHNWH